LQISWHFFLFSEYAWSALPETLYTNLHEAIISERRNSNERESSVWAVSWEVCKLYLQRPSPEHYETGIDPRTVERYVTQHPNELNKSTNKKCGKKVNEECARKGFKITESISGAPRDRRKPPISARRSPRGLSNVEQEGVCATEPGAESNGRRHDFLPPSFSREISSELKLLSRRTETNSHLHPNKRSQLPLVV